jgi:hypothetical protein
MASISKNLRRERTNAARKVATTINATDLYRPPYGKVMTKISGRGEPGTAAVPSTGTGSYNPPTVTGSNASGGNAYYATAPTPVYHYNAGNANYNTGNQIYTPGNQVYNSPTPNYNPPTAVYNPAQPNYNPPTPNYNPPSYTPGNSNPGSYQENHVNMASRCPSGWYAEWYDGYNTQYVSCSTYVPGNSNPGSESPGNVSGYTPGNLANISYNLAGYAPGNVAGYSPGTATNSYNPPTATNSYNTGNISGYNTGNRTNTIATYNNNPPSNTAQGYNPYNPGNPNYSPGSQNYNTAIAAKAGTPRSVLGVTFPGGAAGAAAEVVSGVFVKIPYTVGGVSVTAPPGGYITIEEL